MNSPLERHQVRLRGLHGRVPARRGPRARRASSAQADRVTSLPRIRSLLCRAPSAVAALPPRRPSLFIRGIASVPQVPSRDP
jgi:hypothetical protein